MPREELSLLSLSDGCYENSIADSIHWLEWFFYGEKVAHFYGQKIVAEIGRYFERQFIDPTFVTGFISCKVHRIYLIILTIFTLNST